MGYKREVQLPLCLTFLPLPFPSTICPPSLHIRHPLLWPFIFHIQQTRLPPLPVLLCLHPCLIRRLLSVTTSSLCPQSIIVVCLPSLFPPPASHLLLGPVVINPQHAFDSSPSSFLSSHPPPDRARKVTLLFSSHTCHSIYPCSHLTARPRFERQHVGRAIVDVRQLRWQCHGRLREFPRRRCGHRSGRNAQRASWERRGSAATGSKPGTTSSNVSCFFF